MASANGYGKTITNGLIFSYDTGDIINSYKGEPTTNLIPSPLLNTYPTYGNSWGTYNTNRYYPFFSIGTVVSVTDNIVTTAGSHTMRSFDVLRPETNGGGVFTNTNYFVKRISDTQFSLHAYNSSQDGSQGYINPSTGQFKVHDSYWLDQRVSINSTDFPTSWVGEAHQPNSALVKEIIPSGFNVYGYPKTDCIRAHWFRTDGVTDGMAYGADASVVPGQPVYLTCFMKAVNPNAVGKNVQFYHYTYGVTGPTAYAVNCTIGPVGKWIRYGYTFTTPNSGVISYWFPNSDNMIVDIANIQIEQKDHATTFVPGTRTSAQGLVDLATAATLDVANVSFDSNSQITFDGTNDNIGTDISKNNLGNNCTFAAIINSSGNASGYNMFLGQILPYIGALDATQIIFSDIIGGTQQTIYSGDGITVGENHYVVCTRTYNAGTNQTTNRIYIDSVLKGEGTFSGAPGDYGDKINIGDGQTTNWYPFYGHIYNVSLYNRTLSTSEIRQNYFQYKSRFNLN